MKIFLSVGHSILKDGRITSADGLINEYQYCKRLSFLLQQFLIQKGHEVELVICPEYQFESAKEERKYKLAIENRGRFDLCAELHLNAYSDNTANGSEVYYKTSRGKPFAVSITNKLGMRFKNRGAKKQDGLYMLNRTKAPAVLIETFFCTNMEDCTRGEDVSAVANLIAEGIHAMIYVAD